MACPVASPATAAAAAAAHCKALLPVCLHAGSRRKVVQPLKPPTERKRAM